MASRKGKPNHLANSASPYLQQHAFNPVEWYPWGNEALQKAKQEDKPVIVSIGYSSCHWCHVMERESFESDEIAEIMNSGFVCIKVDREERPDIDQIYMEAVQAMGINGGWPLNVFLTPDQKPFYGGTYFRPDAWKQLLINVNGTYRNNRKEVFDTAEKFSDYIRQSEIDKFNISAEPVFKLEDLVEPVNIIAERFDHIHGGFNRYPKFPMPALWKFLLQFSELTGEESIGNHVHFTLNKMVRGGIYDQVGGGFSRYSTDGRWFAPHFEKMLYDNAQLISLYSEAYRIKKDPLYRETVMETIEFIKREMTDRSGGFYSALDADSEGEEGKFYTWTEKEFDELFPDDAVLLKSYWNITSAGNWEPGKNILAVERDNKEFCKDHKISTDEFRRLVNNAKKSLLESRNKRERPGLDNKMIVAWNGLMIKALTDAYLAFREKEYLEIAEKTAELIAGMSGKNGSLQRLITENDSSIPGYLDDYAHVIEGFIGLYNVTFNERWLTEAEKLSGNVLKKFHDEKEKLFFYKDSGSESLIARKKEIFDNVIPGSNSMTALNFYKLGMMLDHEKLKETAVNMMAGIQQLVKKEPEYLYNWCNLFCLLSIPVAEIAVIGNDFLETGLALQKNHRIDKFVMATGSKSDLPIFRGRKTINDKNTIFVCYNKTCKLPVHSVNEALSLLT